MPHRSHEPLCPVRRWPMFGFAFCQCALIKEVGERIADAISHIDLPTPVEGDKGAEMYALGFTTMSEVAQKIARNGGPLSYQLED